MKENVNFGTRERNKFLEKKEKKREFPQWKCDQCGELFNLEFDARGREKLLKFKENHYKICI